MTGFPADFLSHLATGHTHVCRCWAVARRDGVVMGFTDHDLPLAFEGVAFSPDAGMTARALEQTTGLSVDNSEALGILSADSVTETDILAGRYDGAEVRCWLVNWSDVAQRALQFKGSIGEIQRNGGAFQAELRGLSEALNQEQGRVFQRPCTTTLGSGACQFDVGSAGYFAEVPVDDIEGGKFLTFSTLTGFENRWFERGHVRVQTGEGAGLVGIVKNDRLTSEGRRVELWEALRADVGAGDMIRLEAGCDRRAETCRLKFDNIVNYQGFPTIPGEDWLVSVPRQGGVNNGGSLTS